MLLIRLLQRLELERKTDQRAKRNFDENIRQKQDEFYSITQKIKSLNLEKKILDDDSEDRIKLSMKKSDLETCKKKLKKL